jgi:hypothetical protein
MLYDGRAGVWEVACSTVVTLNTTICEPADDRCGNREEVICSVLVQPHECQMQNTKPAEHEK